jgi:hypothetical protein
MQTGRERRTAVLTATPFLHFEFCILHFGIAA